MFIQADTFRRLRSYSLVQEQPHRGRITPAPQYFIPLNRAPWWPVIPRLGPLRETILDRFDYSSAAKMKMTGKMRSAQGHIERPRLRGAAEQPRRYPALPRTDRGKQVSLFLSPVLQ